MTKIIAVSTNKGGVLKSSLTTHLAGVISSKRKNVLIIDTDNQGNAALTFGHNPDKFNYTIYDVLADGLDPTQAIVNVHKRIDLLPANDDMSFLEFDILSDQNKYPNPFYLLKNAFKPVDISQWDYILIDTPPTLGLTQGNVLTFTDEVLIPFQPESYSMRSLVKILRSIHDFKGSHNPKLEVLGIVATLVDSRTTLHNEVLQECRKYADHNNVKLFDTVIPKSIRFANSVAYQSKPATLTSNKRNELVRSYWDLYKEMTQNG